MTVTVATGPIYALCPCCPDCYDMGWVPARPCRTCGRMCSCQGCQAERD